MSALVNLVRSLFHSRSGDASAIDNAADTAQLLAELKRANAALGELYEMTHLQYQASCWTIREQLLADPRYLDPLRLERNGRKVYSQNDEDGIIEEIFRRIGTTNRAFCEFGVQDGLENNTLNLLNQGWTGGWIEANPGYVEGMRKRFAGPLAQGRLRLAQAMVDRDNINGLIEGLALPPEPDFLSIDIDGNDYHVWEGLSAVRPRVVAIEYNAKFAPPARWVMTYDPRHIWDGSDQFGASIESLSDLAGRKGYRLVGCNLTGANAFFVRADVAAERFQSPASAANFHHPARYFLTQSYVSGHAPGFGKGTLG